MPADTSTSIAADEQGSLLGNLDSKPLTTCSELELTNDEEDEESNGHVVSTTNGAAQPELKTKIFGVLLVVYVTPLGYALAREGFYHSRSTAKSLGMRLPTYLTATPSVASIARWIILDVMLYGLQRRLAKAWHWKMHDKHSATHKEDIFRMGYLSGLFCVAGRVGARLDIYPVSFPALIAGYTLAFGILFEMVRHCNIEFTRECVNNPYTIAFATFVILVLLALAVNHFSLVVALNDRSDFSAELFLLAAVVVFHVVLSAAPGQSSAHWHHWYTGALGSLFCPFDSLSSKVAQAMLLGVYLHGTALFGIEPCFTPDRDPLERN